MKTNGWLFLGAILASSALAQQTTQTPAAAGSPSKKPAEAAKPAPVEKPITLAPGPAQIAGSNINIRGQATFNSEVITRLSTGAAVTVLEKIVLEKPRNDEPAQWAKIAFPANAHVWVHASFVDRTNKTVLPKKLNVRTGPGENYSIVGIMEQGAPVKEISTKAGWIEIEAPANAYAFVAARFLKQDHGALAVAALRQTEAAPAPAPVVQPAPAAPPPTERPATPAVAPAPAPASAPAPQPAPDEGPPPKRIVQHEGVVRSAWSVQSPTSFALVDPASGRTVNYLYTTSTNLDLKRWKGFRVVVTGEEGLDDRWKNTPVLTIQRIQVVE